MQVFNASVAGPAIADEAVIVKLIRTAAKTEITFFILLTSLFVNSSPYMARKL